MLDLGFLPDVERLLKQTPETRQTMLFSATMPAAIVALARTHMRHPMNIRAESGEDTQMVPGHRAVHLPGPRPRQARDARPPAAGRGRRPDDRVHPHQAPGAADRRRPRGARLQLRSPARRHGAGRPREGADEVPRGQAPGARRHRRRRSRHRRHRRHPRRELHLPRGREDLRAPHRPHRPRRRHRHRDHLRRLGRPAPLEDDQQGARPARSTTRRRPTRAPRTSCTTRASPPAPRAGSSPRAIVIERKPRPERSTTAAARAAVGGRGDGRGDGRRRQPRAGLGLRATKAADRLRRDVRRPSASAAATATVGARAAASRPPPASS